MWTPSGLLTYFVEHFCSLISRKWILFPISTLFILVEASLSLALFNHLAGSSVPMANPFSDTAGSKFFKGYELKFAFLYIWLLYIKVKSPLWLAAYSFPASSPPKCISFSKINHWDLATKHTFSHYVSVPSIPQPEVLFSQPVKSYLFFRIKLKCFCT